MSDPGKPRAFRSFAFTIFLVALVLRLLPVLLTPHLGIGLDDMFQYDMLARSLAAGNGFRWYAPADLARLAPYLHLDVAALALDPRGMPTTFRAPLYPAFLALIYAVFGPGADRFFAVRLIQATLSALLPPLTYFTAQHLLNGGDAAEGRQRREQGARLASWAVTVYPMLVIFPLGLATENLFFLLVAALTLVLLVLGDAALRDDADQPRTRRVTRYALLAGLLLGLSALTRSVILPFAGAAILWIAFCLRQTRAALVVVLALAATVAPWIVRNSLLSGRLTGIETSMGYNLYVGYHPQSTGTFTFGPSLDLLSILNDRARDEIGTQRAIEFVREDPPRFWYLALRRLGYFFNLDLRAFTYFYGNGLLGFIPAPVLISILLFLGLPFAVVSLSAALGAASLPRDPKTILGFLLFLTYLLPHVFILSEERFHLTLIPLMAICAANLWPSGFRGLRSPRLGIMLALLACLLLIANWSLELARDGHVLLQLLGPNGNQLYLPY